MIWTVRNQTSRLYFAGRFSYDPWRLLRSKRKYLRPSDHRIICHRLLSDPTGFITSWGYSADPSAARWSSWHRFVGRWRGTYPTGSWSTTAESSAWCWCDPSLRKSSPGRASRRRPGDSSAGRSRRPRPGRARSFAALSALGPGPTRSTRNARRNSCSSRT